MFTVAEHWKAATHTPEQEQLFALLSARLEDAAEPVRLQAAHFLYMLNDERTEPAIARVLKDTEQRRLVTAPVTLISQTWVVGPFPDGEKGFAKVHPPETAAIDVAAAYPVESGDPKGSGKNLAWRQMKTIRMYDLTKEFGPADRSSFYAFARLESPRRQQVMMLVGSDDGIKLWHNGRPVFTNPASRAALPFQDVFFLELEPGSNDLLARVQNNSGDCALYLHFRAQGEVAVTLPEKIGVESLADRLKAAAADPNQAKVIADFLAIDWTDAVRQGDPERGRKLFSADGVGCAKCHATRTEAPVQGGPSLADAAKRFTLPHLVESILLPSKTVSPVFRATLVVTKEGKTYSGLVVTETAEKLDLLLPDAKTQTILKSDIEERKMQDISPMPPGVVKKPEELRDLLAFLLSGD
jgi:putative heme-binding domain-containing protein